MISICKNGRYLSMEPEPYSLGVKFANASANIAAHAASKITHGTTSNIVGLNDSQTLTNKTISAITNTITDVDHTTLTNTGVNTHAQIDAVIQWGYNLVNQNVKTTASPTFAAVTTGQLTAPIISSSTGAIDFNGAMLFNVGQITSNGNVRANQFFYNSNPPTDNALPTVLVFDPSSKAIKGRSVATIQRALSSMRLTASPINQTLPANTPTVVLWDTISGDITVDSAGKFTIQTAGYYTLQFKGIFGTGLSDARRSYFRVREGVVQSLVGSSTVGMLPLGFTFESWSTYSHLFAAGATFEVLVFSVAADTLPVGELYIEKSI